MKSRISGKKYNFFVVCERFGKKYFFRIQARTKSGAHRSCINNVNCILSALDVNIYRSIYEESDWRLPRKEAIRHFRRANRFLKDADIRSDIEKQLDLDRSLGEWNRYY